MAGEGKSSRVAATFRFAPEHPRKAKPFFGLRQPSAAFAQPACWRQFSTDESHLSISQIVSAGRRVAPQQAAEKKKRQGAAAVQGAAHPNVQTTARPRRAFRPNQRPGQQRERIGSRGRESAERIDSQHRGAVISKSYRLLTDLAGQFASNHLNGNASGQRSGKFGVPRSHYSAI